MLPHALHTVNMERRFSRVLCRVNLPKIDETEVSCSSQFHNIKNNSLFLNDK